MDIIEFSGYCYRYIFKKGNYMVVSICSADSYEKYYTCVGEYYKFENNKIYDFKCIEENNDRFGKQYRVIEVSPVVPHSKTQIIKFLSSNNFKGVGKKCAENVYKVLGDDALLLIKENFDVLNDVDITQDQRQSIIDGFINLGLNIRPEITELISYGFSFSEANMITHMYKEKTLEVLHTNPFNFYYDCPYISLKNINIAADKLEIDNIDELRSIADLVGALKDYTFRHGHIFVKEEDLSNVFSSFDNYEYLLNKCIEEGIIIYDKNRYYFKDHYNNEQTIANVLNTINKYHDEDIRDVEVDDSEIEYDDKQIEAIKNFFKNNISIISGGPGTGKTTIIKAIVDIYKKEFPSNDIIVIAPTGRAAKRINEMCNVQTKTIHSLLRWNKEYNYFTHNKDNPLFYDAIIIDEFSMVDNEIFAKLLDANRSLKKLCLIGDYNQLPSIREGDLLKNFIDSKLFPTVMLTKIFRQSEGNGIIKFANDIINNSIDYDSYNDDVRFYNVDNYSLDKYIEDLNKDFDYNYTFDDIQVLSPVYKNKFGVDELNKVTQDVYNPCKNDLDACEFSELALRKNDKVLQLKNRSDYDLCNGDIGYILDVDNDNEEIMVSFNDNTYIYTNRDLSEGNLDLAYAITIHKSQGSEYRIVYLFLGHTHSNFVNKKILYTAVSRAKQRLNVISTTSIITKCLSKDIPERNTSVIDFYLEKNS